MESETRKIEDSFRNLADYIPVSIQGYRTDGTVFYWNEASERLYGYSAREALGRNLGDLIIPAAVQPVFRKALAAGAAVTGSGEFLPPGELELLHKDGAPVPVYSIHTAVYIEGEDPLLYCIDVDLSERRRMEEELVKASADLEKRVKLRTRDLARVVVNLQREVEERKKAEAELKKFKTIADEAKYGIAIAEPDGRLNYINRHFARMHQHEPEELIGKKMAVFHTPEQMERVDLLVSRLLADGSFHTEEVWHRKKDGSVFPTIMNATTISDPEGNPVFITATAVDITDRHRAGREKRQMREQLRQAQKMEAVARLAGGMAHDFGNLLNAIRGYVEVIKNKLHEEDPLQEEIRELDESIIRAAKLNRKLLTFGRRQPVRPEEIDLNSVLQDLENMLRRICGNGGRTIGFSFLPDLPRILIDRDQLEQVIINLVLNARDAVARQGTIRVETGNYRHQPSAGSTFPAKNPGPYVRLTVQDTGCGMSQEDRDHLFDPFFTTKSRDRNTGLGLAVVYGIIDQAGGFIRVTSQPERGTTFDIFFPAVSGSRAAGGRRPKRILLLDDEETIRETVEELAAHIGCRVESAPEGSLAVELFLQERAAGRPFDILLLDLMIPGGKGGVETLAEIRKIDSGIKAVLLTGYLSAPVVKSYREHGFSAVLEKPFTHLDLKEAIRKAAAIRTNPDSGRSKSGGGGD